MENQSNPSLIADPEFPATQGALPVWIKVFTKPGEQTFLSIIGHPEARARSAYLWVFLAGTLSGLVGGLTQFLATMIGLKQLAPELGQVQGLTGIFGTAGLVGAICSAPLTGLFSLIGFIIGVAIIHASAKFLGGQGTFDQMAYSFGAVVAPLTVISALTTPFNLIPYLAFCIIPMLLLLSFYALFLEVAAIKAVHRFGWLGSVGALFMPTILIAMLCGFVFLGLLRLAGPSLQDIIPLLQQMPRG